MRLAAVIVAAIGLAGCATVVEGTNEDVTVATNPPGASCSVDRAGTRLGTIPVTPGSLKLSKSKNDLTITCVRPGFQPAVVGQTANFVGTTFGNIIIGGGVGAIVDAASGANYTYHSPVLIAMAPLPGAAPGYAAGYAPGYAPGYAMAGAPPPAYPMAPAAYGLAPAPPAPSYGYGSAPPDLPPGGGPLPYLPPPVY